MASEDGSKQSRSRPKKPSVPFSLPPQIMDFQKQKIYMNAQKKAARKKKWQENKRQKRVAAKVKRKFAKLEEENKKKNGKGAKEN